MDFLNGNKTESLKAFFAFICVLAARHRPQPNGDVPEEVVDEVIEPVLVVRLPGELDAEVLLTETKVLEMEGKLEPAPARCAVDGQDLPDSADTSQSQEKRTR